MNDHWLVNYAQRVNEEQRKIGKAQFLKNAEENDFLNDIEHYPHAFVLACCMDKQVPAEKAWHIPWAIKEECSEFTIAKLSAFSFEWYRDIFIRKSLHRFNNVMSQVFHNAVHHILENYEGDASKIWSGKPSSAAVVYRFLQFDGVGVKIATMAANILTRELGVQFSDCYSIDISTDVHVMRVFKRIGLVSPAATRDEVIYKARELCPDYPGITDSACWTIGRYYCHESEPECEKCPISVNCKKCMIKRSRTSYKSMAKMEAEFTDEALYDPKK